MHAIFPSLRIICGIILLPMQASCGQEPQDVSLADQQVDAARLQVNHSHLTQKASLGDEEMKFRFELKNTSDKTITIQQISTSCGCTTTEGIELPFSWDSQKSIAVPIKMNFLGKSGTLTKSIIVITDQGFLPLEATAIIPVLDPALMTENQRREANRRTALADSQAIFRNDCASCHVKPTEGRLGKELYETACGICHEAVNRASMVPDLKFGQETRDASYWRTIITDGREGTLMPAFAKKHHGILDEKQIESLVTYLAQEFNNHEPKKP
jgi:mono/diheme cytochrome c family protein